MTHESPSETGNCPYSNLPEQRFFRGQALKRGDLVLAKIPEFQFSAATKCISAGSCFAARIVSVLKDSGIHYLMHRDIAAADPDDIREEGPSAFSARYGNIYTAKHMLQLLQRSMGIIAARPPTAIDKHGRFRNLLRPSTLSYSNTEVLEHDDAAHLANVRDLFFQSDLFVFTLGLTEYWTDAERGLALPGAPGCGYGVFDERRHKFHNASLSEVTQELLDMFQIIDSLNPRLKMILTLSPVPLVATYEPVSAVEATFYSKTVLRQAITEAMSRWQKQNVSYFPSYEIVTNPHMFETYIGSDRRDVSEAAIASVMGQFKRRYFDSSMASPATDARTEIDGDIDPDPICDEENVWLAYVKKMANEPR